MTIGFVYASASILCLAALPAEARPFDSGRDVAVAGARAVVAVIDRSKAGFRSCKQACERKHYCVGRDGPEKSACIAKKQACIAACK